VASYGSTGATGVKAVGPALGLLCMDNFYSC
jgi:hypothetical protein